MIRFLKVLILKCINRFSLTFKNTSNEITLFLLPASGSDWVLLAESSPLIVQTKELRPGSTATGSFTFAGAIRESLVCYCVTLNTDNIGSGDSNPANNIYIGVIPTKK